MENQERSNRRKTLFSEISEATWLRSGADGDVASAVDPALDLVHRTWGETSEMLVVVNRARPGRYRVAAERVLSALAWASIAVGDRLGTGVERIEYCVAVRPRPLGQHVDRIDQRRSERGELVLDAGRHLGVRVAADESVRL